MRCPVFIINLARSTDRRQHMEAELQKVGITDYTFVNAVDGNDLQPEVILAHQEKILQHYNLTLVKGAESYARRKLYRVPPKSQQALNKNQSCCYQVSNYELACSLSHLKCYELLLASDAEAALILEDDAILSTDLSKIINNIDHFSPNWQVAYAVSRQGLRGLTNIYTRKKVCEDYTMGQATCPIWHALAYFISRKGATYWRHTRNLLGGDYPNIEAFCEDLPTKADSLPLLLLMHYPADEWLWHDRFNRYLYNHHIITPGLATWAPESRNSTIIVQELRNNPRTITLSFWSRWFIVRVLRYLYHMIGGRISMYGLWARTRKLVAIVTPFTTPSKRQW